jgi:CheY-like chemotaxis protein
LFPGQEDDKMNAATLGDELVMPHTRQRVLVVDDSRDGADSLGMVLKMLGAEAEVVYDGPSAIAAIRAERPATVLLDLGMPGMDGYQVAAEIRKDPALSGIRLIALTGWGSEEERRRSREAGFDDHWVKPVDPARLRALVDPTRP